jgi:hypothetical protein
MKRAAVVVVVLVVVVGAEVSRSRDAAAQSQVGAAGESPAQPVLLYTTSFHAKGQPDYQPDGPYAEVLKRLGADFEVRAHGEPISRKTLKGVKVVLIANPSFKGHRGGPEPHHFDRNDVFQLVNFVQHGGGLIFLSNQSSAHNCEKQRANELLRHFGIRATHYEVGVKRYEVPRDTPIVGGLAWAFYYGCVLEVDEQHLARPRVLLRNDPELQPLQGVTGPDGPVLALAEVGKGRVVVAADTGWITDWAMDAIGEDRIQEQDNWRIFQRLAKWVAGGA